MLDVIDLKAVLAALWITGAVGTFVYLMIYATPAEWHEVREAGSGFLLFFVPLVLAVAWPWILWIDLRSRD